MRRAGHPRRNLSSIKIMKIAYSLLIPLILIATGFSAYRLIAGLSSETWQPDKVYAVWIEEAEVAAQSTKGRWDDDGSAPDLVASLQWRGNTVLKTPEAPNTLLAHWERTALQLANLIKGKFSPTELENIARIRAEQSENLTIEVRDVDILSTEWVGAVSIPCGALKTGKNIILVNSPDCQLRSVVLRVEDAERLKNGCLEDSTNTISEQVAVIDEPVADKPSAVEVHEVGKQLESGAKFLRNLFNSEESK